MKRLTTTLRYWAAGLLIVFGVLLVMAEANDRQARQEQMQR